MSRVMLGLGKGDLNHVKSVDIFWSSIHVLLHYQDNFRQELTLQEKVNSQLTFIQNLKVDKICSEV